MLQHQTQTFRIGRALDAHTGAAQFDLNTSAVNANWPDMLVNWVGHSDRHQLRHCRLFVEPAFAKQLPPLKDLIRIHTMPARQYRYRNARLQRLFGNPPPLLLRPMTPLYFNGPDFPLDDLLVPHLHRPLPASANQRFYGRRCSPDAYAADAESESAESANQVLNCLVDIVTI